VLFRWLLDERDRARLERRGWREMGRHCLWDIPFMVLDPEPLPSRILAHIRRLWQGLVVSLTWGRR